MRAQQSNENEQRRGDSDVKPYCQLQSTRLSGTGHGDIIRAVALVGHTVTRLICSPNPTLNHPRIISETGCEPESRYVPYRYAVHITCTDFAQPWVH